MGRKAHLLEEFLDQAAIVQPSFHGAHLADEGHAQPPLDRRPNVPQRNVAVLDDCAPPHRYFQGFGCTLRPLCPARGKRLTVNDFTTDLAPIFQRAAHSVSSHCQTKNNAIPFTDSEKDKEYAQVDAPQKGPQ